MEVLKSTVLRLSYTALILLCVSLMVFAVTELLPGNVITMILGTDATEAEIRRLTALMGLDLPAWQRYLNWVSSAIQGDLGTSLRMQQPISGLLLQRMGDSLVLASVAFVMVAVGGILIGLVTALFEGTRIDRYISAIAAIGTSLPEFVTGTVFVLIFAGGVFSWFPPSGYGGLGNGLGPALHELFLPALTLSIVLMAYVGRVTRTSTIDALRSDYVRTARLKGLPEWQVITRHVIPNAFVPTVTVLFMNIGWMVGGIVVVEAVFVFPGIGRLMLFAIAERDWPLIQACALAIAAIYVFSNLVGDLLALWLNPRLRVEGR